MELKKYRSVLWLVFAAVDTVNCLHFPLTMMEPIARYDIAFELIQFVNPIHEIHAKGYETYINAALEQ